MNPFDAELNQRLTTLREQGMYRALRRVDSPQSRLIKINGKSFLNFSSNDYLGLANHPALKEASIKAVKEFGSGTGASRLVCGSLAPFHELEEALADFKGTQAALTFSTGYAAALGTITALLGTGDVIIIDKRVHASIVDAAKLSGAKLRVFAHNDLDDLEKILKWASSRITHHASRSPDTSHLTSRTLIVTESIFSMDGDAAPLKEIAALKDKYGAWLMLDEAHTTGLYGKKRRGLAEELGVSDRIEIQMGTLGKAIGASGGYICGSRTLIDYLINRARSFIFSTAPSPASAAAATAGIQLVQSAEGKSLNKKLWSRVANFRSEIVNQKSEIQSAIFPIIIGEERRAIEAANELYSLGIFVPAIRYPSVARGSARLRVTLTAAHTKADITRLTTALAQLETQNPKPETG